VLGALAQLSFNQRSALVMRELEGRSYQEISEVIGVSVSAVEALIFRARRRLQLERNALGVITAVPLPGSLAGLFGGGGAVAAGGAAFGADVVLKAVAVAVLGTAVAGAGYKTVAAVNASEAAARPLQALSMVAPAQHHAAARVTAAAHRTAKAHRIRQDRPSAAAGQTTRPSTTTASAAAPQQATVAPSAPSTSASPVPSAVVVKTPPLPVAPPVTVTGPQLPPLPPLPPVPPVTVTVPPLRPPPPPLP
jgi:hypothetical protein